MILEKNLKINEGATATSNKFNRKLLRKAKKKEKKMKRAFHYANIHKSEKVHIKEKDLNELTILDSSNYLKSALKDKILLNENSEKGSDIKKKKNKKKKNKAVNNKKPIEENSFKVVDNNSERLARLREYVEQESKRMETKSRSKTADCNETTEEKPKKNLINDKKRLIELYKGQKDDTKQINKLGRALGFNKNRKNKVCKVFNDEFGSIIDDISSGKISSLMDGDNCIHSDDEDLEKDVYNALGKDFPSCVNNEDDDINSDISEDISQEEAIDGEEDETVNCPFIDDEAEEGSTEEDEVDAENDEALAFEGGSFQTTFSPNGNFKKELSVFDLYDDESEEDEDSSDLDGFIVDDDFVEYDSNENDLESDIDETFVISKKKSFKKENKNSQNTKGRKRIISNSSQSSLDDRSIIPTKSGSKRQRIESTDSEDLKNIEMKVNGILKKGKCDKNTKLKRVSFGEPLENTKAISENDYTEDIYGRLRDKEGNIIDLEKETLPSEKYIPPAQRKLMSLGESKSRKEILAALQKNLKGLLNRLAESNMPGIASQIEGIFKEHSHNNVNEALTKLLLESLVLPSLTPDRLIQDHACLISCLSANVGVEVGAHIFTEFVIQFKDDLEKGQRDDCETKKLDNLLHFIVQLYNFKVVHSQVIYDILQELSDRFQEKEIELILLVLRSVGFTLRKADPLALKQFIVSVQTKAFSSPTSENFTRVRFMLEVLTAIKNNNMNKVPNYDPRHGEHLRTLMKAIIRRNCSPSELRVSLSDIIKSRTAGKWWIVGSAWSGGLKENQDFVEKEKSMVSNTSHNYTDEFTRKATKLHLGRPPRINILYVLTDGSEDYIDAFEKLLQLKLPVNQEQEIFNVMLVCCLKGKEYNKFYSLVANKLCLFHKRFKRPLQFALWDKFKELSSMKPGRITNLAKFLAEVIAEDGLNLSVLKNLPLLETDGALVSFLRQMLVTLLLHPMGDETIHRAFNKVCSTPKLNVLRQSLRVFLLQFVKPKKSAISADMKVLSSKVDIAVNILMSDEGVSL